jgi:hypothetical protein
MGFSQGGVVSTSPDPPAGEPPLVGCPRLLIQLIHSYPPYQRPFLLYRTIILPVVVFGCGSWSLALREERRLRVFENWVLRGVLSEERRLRVFENWVLRGVFGPEGD